MICDSGRVSLCCFLSTLSFGVLFLLGMTYGYLPQNFEGIVFGLPLYFLCMKIVLTYYSYSYEIAVRAVFLGFVIFIGIFIKIYGEPRLQIFGVYMCIMATFHYTEFLSIAIIQPSLVSKDSYVINHSKEYTIAAVSSWIEYFIEYYFFPSIKSYTWLSNFGLMICIGGEILRKCAMFTAKSNFNHIVQCEKDDNHVLVTHGIYSLFRHPSYVGWFYWSIGTQITLLNPFCVVAYAFVSWNFFRERINIEEYTLLNFFGKQYYDYQQKVSTGLPLINGYRIN